MSARPTIAALGDSLTEGEHADGLPVHNHPWPEYLDAALFTDAGVGQFGVGGDTTDQMLVRFNTVIVPALSADGGPAFKVVIVWGGVNNLIAGATAAAAFAPYNNIVSAALALSMRVIAVITPGFKAYAGWSAPAQAQFDLFRPMVAALASTPGVTVVDLYAPAPAGMDDPNDPESLLPAWRYSDGLHINPAGALHLGYYVFAPVLRALYPIFGGPALPILKQSISGKKQVLLVQTTPSLHITVQLPGNVVERVYDDGFADGYTGEIQHFGGITQVWINRSGGWPVSSPLFSANS